MEDESHWFRVFFFANPLWKMKATGLGFFNKNPLWKMKATGLGFFFCKSSMEDEGHRFRGLGVKA